MICEVVSWPAWVTGTDTTGATLFAGTDAAVATTPSRRRGADPRLGWRAYIGPMKTTLAAIASDDTTARLFRRPIFLVESRLYMARDRAAIRPARRPLPGSAPCSRIPDCCKP